MMFYVLVVFALVSGGYARKHFIVDVDGSIDSCQSIAYLMNGVHRDEFDLDIIVSAASEVPDTAINNVARCLQILEVSKHINVYAGANCTLSTDHSEFSYYGSDGFGDLGVEVPKNTRIQPTPAPLRIAELLADTTKEYYYIATGILTNLAIAMTTYAHVCENLKNIYVVGGNFPGEYLDAYFKTDPEAVHIVLKRSISPVKLLTLRNCVNHGIDYNWRKSVEIDNPYFNIINRAERNSFLKNANREYDVCGPLLISTILNPENLLSSEPATIAVDRCANRGHIIPATGPVNVEFIRINGEKYKEFFVEEFNNICKNFECCSKYELKEHKPHKPHKHHHHDKH